MTTPRVSVITATYNWSSVLRCAIESVRGQTFADFEMLVVGDGCTDDSGDVVASFGDPRIRWNNLPSNSGHQSAGNNAGLALARGEFVAYLGHDDLWFPTHLEALVAALDESRADIAYAWSVLVLPAPSPMRVISGVNPTGQFERDLGVPPSSLMHRRSVYEELGGWKNYGEISEEPEVELLARALNAGKRFVPVRNLSVFKFNSAFRPNSYIEKPSHEQAEYLRRMKEEPDFIVRELAAIIETQIGRHPEDLPRAHDWSGSAPGTAVRRLRVARGLEPSEKRTADAAPFAPFEIAFGSEAAEPCLLYGWAAAEQGFRWNDGKEAAVGFRLERPMPLRLSMRLAPFLGWGRIAEQIVEVSINNRPIHVATFGSEGLALLECMLGEAILREVNQLTLKFPNAASPASLGRSMDLRYLAIAMHAIELSPN
jgi:hypothetical protein